MFSYVCVVFDIFGDFTYINLLLISSLNILYVCKHTMYVFNHFQFTKNPLVSQCYTDDYFTLI